MPFPAYASSPAAQTPQDARSNFERLFLLLVDSNPFQPKVTYYEVNDPETPVELSAALEDIVELVAEQNFDLYEASGDGLIRGI